MSRSKELANIFKKVGDALYQAADELNALAAEVTVNDPAQSAPAPRPAAADSLPAAPARPPQESDFAEGAEAMCPKHHVLYENGQYGPYCKQRTDDPAWGKEKNGNLWCKITPRNAATYLRVQAAA